MTTMSITEKIKQSLARGFSIDFQIQSENEERWVTISKDKQNKYIVSLSSDDDYEFKNINNLLSLLVSTNIEEGDDNNYYFITCDQIKLISIINLITTAAIDLEESKEDDDPKQEDLSSSLSFNVDDKDIYTLIGIRELKEVQNSNSYGSKEMTQYTVFLSKVMLNDDNELHQLLYSFEAKNTYGDCYSGASSSTWGEFTSFTIVKEIGTLHYVPKKKEFKVKYINENNSHNDKLTTITGEIVVGCSVNGGDDYYPRGCCWIVEDFFNKTNRHVPERLLYLFSGASRTGKSFIANHLKDLKTYETDKDENIPDNIGNYHVIVIGNKYPSHKEKVESLLKDKKDVKLIQTIFSSLE
jgi:hypothetical protein